MVITKHIFQKAIGYHRDKYHIMFYNSRTVAINVNMAETVGDVYC